MTYFIRTPFFFFPHFFFSYWAEGCGVSLHVQQSGDKEVF